MFQLKLFLPLLLLFLTAQTIAVNDEQFLDKAIKDEEVLKTIITQSENKVVIELLIVCDYDFSLSFNFERTEIIKYLEALIWDVHLKYKTLKNADISFQLNELIIIESHEEQPFIESVRNNETGKVELKQVLLSFGNWLYLDDISSYDIAVAVVGADCYIDLRGIAFAEGACSLNSAIEQVHSSLVFSITAPNPASVLTHEIAHLLSAPHDSETECNTSIHNSSFGNFIMHPNEAVYGTNAFYFSPCSSYFIKKFLTTYQANYCFRNSTFEDSAIIDTSNPSSISSVGISIEKQCKILLNDSSSVSAKFEKLTILNALNYSAVSNSTCDAAACISGNTSTTTSSAISSTAFYKFLVPLGGSPCNYADASKRCIFGLCIFPGFQLVSSLTGDYARSLDYFSSDDFLSMYYYNSGFEFPFSLINIKKGSEDSVLLSSLYFTDAGNNVSTKCLTLTDWEPEESWIKTTLSNRLGSEFPHAVATFQQCSEESPSLRWDIIFTQELGTSQFILKHIETQMCISSVPISDRIIGSSCHENDTTLRWSLLSKHGTIIREKGLRKFLGKSGGKMETKVSSEGFGSYLWKTLNGYFGIVSFVLILAIFGLVLFTCVIFGFGLKSKIASVV